MKSIKYITLAILIGSLAWAAQAADNSGNLRGNYYFHGKTLIDPPPGEAKDTHLGLVLEGNVARELYRKMKVKSEPDLCLDDGSRTKTQGAISCTELAKKKGWRCEFGIELETQKLVRDGVC